MTPADLRLLAEHAERGGAPPSWLQATIAALLELYLATDPRRLASIEKAITVRKAIAAGATPADIKARFGLSRATFYRLRRVS